MSTTGAQDQAFETGCLNVSLDGVNQGIAQGDVGTAFGIATRHGHSLLPNNFTWTVTQAGTAAATMQADLQGSIDQINWYALDSTTTVAAFQMRHVTYKPVRFIRVKLITLTGGDGTTAISSGITA